MFHVHNCIFEGIKYHNLQHDIIFTDRESPFLPSLCNTEVNEIPSFKGGAVIAMIETVYQGGESIRSKYTNIPPYLRNSALTISTNALRLQTCQDEKKNRKERKSIDKHSYARLRKDLQEEQWPSNEPSLCSKQSETKKDQQTKQLPRKLEITFPSFYNSNFFFLGECERSIYVKKRVQTPLKKILYIRLVKITTTFGLN